MQPMIIAICGEAATGKAQPNSTIIPTPKGPVQLGQLQIGDFVYSRKGTPEKIVGVYPQGEKEVYRVKFSDGRATLAAKDHIFTCITSRNNFMDKTVEELYQYYLNGTGNHKIKIPINEPVEYATKNFPIPPYVVGAFLGDECCLEPQLTISSEDIEIPQRIAELLPYDVFPKKRAEASHDYRFELAQPQDQRKYLYTLDVFDDVKQHVCVKSFNKGVPPIYKYGDISQRYELLQGLLDTDGSIGLDGSVSFSTTSKKMLIDVQEVCWSLGFLTSISVEKRHCKYTSGAAYTLKIKTSSDNKMNLFTLSRKQQRLQDYTRHQKEHYEYEWLYISSVEKLGYKESMTCIYVDDEEHLYLTNDYIVTHNTTLLNALVPALRANKMVSDTTRPMRPNEVDGIDYNFISKEEFLRKVRDQEYLEWTCFRGWFYGTPASSIRDGINVGVFNLDGVKSLYQIHDRASVFPIYLKTSVPTRIMRYIRRDGRLSFECFRRLLTDFVQFFFAEPYLDTWYPQHLVLKNFEIDKNLDKLIQYIVYRPSSGRNS